MNFWMVFQEFLWKMRESFLWLGITCTKVLHFFDISKQNLNRKFRISKINNIRIHWMIDFACLNNSFIHISSFPAHCIVFRAPIYLKKKKKKLIYIRRQVVLNRIVVYLCTDSTINISSLNFQLFYVTQ